MVASILTGAGLVLAVAFWLVEPPKRWQPKTRHLLWLTIGTILVTGVVLLAHGHLTDEARSDPPGSLMRLTSPAFSGTCQASGDTGGDGKPLAMTCRPQSGAEWVTYELVASDEALEQRFGRQVDDRGMEPGDCENDSGVTQAFDYVYPQASGELLCYIEDGRSWIEWVDRTHDVYAVASRDDRNDTALYEWWWGSGLLSRDAASEAALLSAVPRSYRDDCAPDFDGSVWHQNPSMLAGLDCSTDDGFSLSYYLFKSQPTLARYFRHFLRRLEVERVGSRASELCPQLDSAVVGTYGDSRADVAGRVVCYTPTDTRYIVWTHAARQIFAFASPGDGPVGDLYSVWRYGGPY